MMTRQDESTQTGLGIQDRLSSEENLEGSNPGARSRATMPSGNVRAGIDALENLVAGVVAAPETADGDGWMCLVPGKLSKAEVEDLRALKRRLTAERRDGLDGKRSQPERLKQVRIELMARELDGFIVPRADEHQGEYVARRAERLAWLTGFTGSAGLAIVLVRKAAVFVDGRYTLQADQEVDGELYDICHLAQQPPSAWLKAEVRKGGRIGYDPWLLTPQQVQRYRQACEAAGAELVALESNPLDAVWTDQPPAPISPVMAHPKAFSGVSSSEKRKALAKLLKDAGADAQVLSQPDSIAWLLNVRGADVPRTPLALSFAVIHKTGDVDWFIDARKLHPKLQKQLGKGVSVHAPDQLGARLSELGRQAATVRIDPALDPKWIETRLESVGAPIVRGPDLCLLPKACKNATEISGMRNAHRRDGVAMARFLAWLPAAAKSGKLTELETSDKLLSLRAENEHFRDLSFDTISGAGANGAVIHYRATEKTNRKLRSGQLFLLDSGGQYLDGTTDITRTIAIGPPKREMKERFTRVLRGHIALATAVFPEGTTGSQLDPLARNALWEVGLDYDHGTGHGVGSYLSVHEGPQRISKAPSQVALKPGMVISNEPGYYKPGAYGIRIENLILVRSVDGPKGAERPVLAFETLTLAPIDRTLILPEMLSAHELNWLNSYHQTVWRELKDLVDKKTRTWLKAATKRIKL